MLACLASTMWMCQPLRWQGTEQPMVKREQEITENIRIKRKRCPKRLIDDSTKPNSQGTLKT